jgi:hypothetical protein
MLALGIPWSGDLGVQSSFEFEGVFFVVTAPGIYGEGDGYYDAYIRDELAANDSLWRVSAWHQNMKRMQTGSKASTTGWGVYEESRRVLVRSPFPAPEPGPGLLGACALATLAALDRLRRRDLARRPPPS